MTVDADDLPGTARSVYELHLIHPTTDERHTGQIKALLFDLILIGTNPQVSSPFVKVTLEVVDRRTSSVVVTMRESAQTAHRLAGMIEADLDRLDEVGFATEWGIKPTP